MIISGIIGIEYVSIWRELLCIPIVFIMGLGFIGLGITLASKIESHEGFQMMMTFITFPIIMTSTAFYPMENLPGWLSIPVHLNPLTYGVEALRWMLLDASDVPITLSLTVITAFALIMMGMGSWAFDRAGDQ